jgi:hypothetical protein
MNRPILACAFFALASAALGAQDASQSSPYQGTSNPPADDAIITTEVQAKPPAGHPMEAAPAQSTETARPDAQMQTAPRSSTAAASTHFEPQANGDGTDAGLVGVAPEPPSQSYPSLATRRAPDPDEDIVHPEALPPGTLGEGTMIRVRLLTSLSSSSSERGEAFRSRVATDVLQGGQVLIPAGSEINGRVADVSSGSFGGHGSLQLQPETVTMADGTSYNLHAEVNSTPGSHTRVGAEGVINPGSRMKRAGIEYGAVVGGGAITGAVMAGPAGALAGSIVGAGVVTAHLLMSHPQANLESGTVLILTLTEPMHMTLSGAPGN